MVSIVTTGGTTLTTSQSSTAVDDPTSTGLSLSSYITSNARMTEYTNNIDTITSKISTNTTKISYYAEMQTLLQSLSTAAKNLAGADSQGTSSDVFSERSASLTSSSSTSAASLLTASVDSGTTSATHSVVVQQIATAEQIAGTGQTSASSGLNYSGSFTIGAGTNSATLSISSTMTLSDIASAINDTSSASGVSASVVEVSSTSFVLEITASNTDQTITMSDLSGDILSGLGLADSSGNAVNVVSAAQPAIITVDGITGITRTSNSIKDVLTGVNLELAKADTSTTLTLAITANTKDITSAISSFISAYNSWENFVSGQQATNSDGTATSTAVLFGDSLLRDVSTAIGNSLAGLVHNASLGAIGITFDSNYDLTLNTATLSSALSDQLTTVAELFEYTVSSSSNNLSLETDNKSSYSGTMGLSLTSDSNGTITSVSASDLGSGEAISFSIAGDVVTAATGGLASGLSFAFSGSDMSASINISITQGIADAIYQICENYGNSSTGFLQQTIISLQDQDTDLTTRKSDLTTAANTYYDQLLTNYGNVQAQISTNNSMYKLLTELISSTSSSN